jgi:translation initiation factor IF-3
MIRIPNVRVVDEDGSQLGVMPTAQALAMAQDRGLDLVEVAPMASPPVVRFLDYGQYKYELAKRDKEAKRRQRAVTFKEVRLRPKIGVGDFDTKVHRATEFLEDGDRIKVTVQFRGREMTHPELGRALLERFVERIKDHGTVERAPLMEGRSIHITVASVHKPKVAEGKLGEIRPGEEKPSLDGPDARPTADVAPSGPAAVEKSAGMATDGQAVDSPAMVPAPAAEAKQKTEPAPAAEAKQKTEPAPAAAPPRSGDGAIKGQAATTE